MEVDSRFIQNVLEMWLTRRDRKQAVELTPLFEFLESLKNSTSQKTRLIKFIDKWRKRLPKTSQNVLLMRLSGTWNPKFASSAELRKCRQKNWESFAKEFDDSFKACTVNSQSSPNYQPLNFKELLRLTFWKELYETFGQDVVSHIFRKCALIYTIEEGLFLYIASPQVPWHKKLSPDKKFCTVSTTASTKKPLNLAGNPYQLRYNGDVKPVKATTVSQETFKNGLESRKRLLAGDYDCEAGESVNEVEEPCRKRIKMDDSVRNGGNTIPPRWIKAKPDVLEKLVNLRNKIIASHKKAIKSEPTTPNTLTFVQIQPEAEFQPKDKLLPVKQICKVNVKKPKLPRALQGLKLPDNLKDFADHSGQVDIVTYTVSDTLAKQLNIRIKPKGRQKKKKRTMPSHPVQETCPEPKSAKRLESIPEFKMIPLPVSSEYSEKFTPCSSQLSTEPYYTTHLLPVFKALYNKCAWSKWPEESALMQSVQLYKAQTQPNIESVKPLAEAIFNQDVCAKGVSCELREIIPPFSGPDKPLNEILLRIVRSHYLVKDFHKVVKSCLSFWQTKCFNKQLKSGKCKKTELPQPPLVDIADSPAEINLATPEVCQIPLENTQMARAVSQESVKKRTFNKLKYAIPHNCLMLTLKQLFHILKVDELLGSKRNIRGFFKFVRKAIVLGGIHSRLHLGELMAHIHAEDIPTMKLTGCPNIGMTYTAKLLTWMFSDYLLVLLKTCFYITEGNFSKNQMRFYLREGWLSTSAKMKTQMKEKGALKRFRSRLSQFRRPNSRLRFLPKQNNTVRSLILTAKQTWDILTDDQLKLVNKFLHFVDAKVNKARMYIPGTLQCEWRRYVREWKERGSPRLWYLRMDIRDAFPSVSLTRLQEILAEAGRQVGGRLSMKFFSVLGSNGSNRTKDTLFDGNDRTNWHSGIQVRPAIVIDQCKDKDFDVEEIVKHCIKVIDTKTVIKEGKKLYEFNLGLPQGWRQSPILCSIYYGSIDSAKYLPSINTETGIFLRIVDDYLYITDSAQDVMNLINLMAPSNSAQEGITFNSSKSMTNALVQSNMSIPESSCDWVTFCGWNFCLTCGHVSRDFSKYKGNDFCSAVKFQMLPNGKASSPEAFLRLRGTIIIASRIKPILLDPMTNCFRRIIVNVFEAAICLSFRFYAICRVIYPSLHALKDPLRVDHIFYCLNLCANRLASYSFRHAKYRVYSNSNENSYCSCSCVVPADAHDKKVDGNLEEERLDLFTYFGDDHNSIVSVDALKFTSLLGFRVKMAKHLSVTSELVKRIDLSTRKMEKTCSFANNGVTVYAAIKQLVGSRMPECFTDILK